MCYFAYKLGRSQWPRILRYVWSWTSRKLWSLVRVSLEARMCTRVSLCCTVLCKYRPCDGSIPRPRSPPEVSGRDLQFQKFILFRNKPEVLVHETYKETRCKLTVAMLITLHATWHSYTYSCISLNIHNFEKISIEICGSDDIHVFSIITIIETLCCLLHIRESQFCSIKRSILYSL
jgi:hypothetical protein